MPKKLKILLSIMLVCQLGSVLITSAMIIEKHHWWGNVLGFFEHVAAIVVGIFMAMGILFVGKIIKAYLGGFFGKKED